MASASHHALKVFDRFRVSPSPGTPPAASLPLTFFDVFWLYTSPVERVFFYRLPLSAAHFIDSVVPNLVSSLSLALRHFYPLAGHLRLSPGSDERFEIHYTDGDSVPFTVAECNYDFNELSGDHARENAKLRALVPNLQDGSGCEMQLLALQATVFPERGLAIGVAVHHVACDGASSMRFVKSWAAACRSGGSVSPVELLPVYDRTLITDPRGLYSNYLNDRKQRNADQPPPLAGVVLGSFLLSREHVEKLKQRVLENPREDGGDAPLHLSTFVVALAYAWSCRTRARACTKAGKRAHLVFPVDCRERLSPALPPAYFGNCIAGCFVSAAAESLGGDDGFVVASERIGRAIGRLEDGVMNGAEEWIRKFGRLAAEGITKVAGSPKLRVYGTDFGWGAAAKVEVVSIGRTGAVSLAESRDGRGGVEIGLALPPPEMNEFAARFRDGLQLL